MYHHFISLHYASWKEEGCVNICQYEYTHVCHPPGYWTWDGCTGVLWVEWGWSFLLGQNLELLYMGFAIVEYVW
jgi:hypothetical protein